MKRLLLMTLLMLVTACATGPQPYTYLNAPDKASTERQRDEIECRALAAQAASGAGSWWSDRALRAATFESVRDRYLAQCLEGRGWAWYTDYR